MSLASSCAACAWRVPRACTSMPRKEASAGLSQIGARVCTRKPMQSSSNYHANNTHTWHLEEDRRPLEAIHDPTFATHQQLGHHRHSAVIGSTSTVALATHHMCHQWHQGQQCSGWPSKDANNNAHRCRVLLLAEAHSILFRSSSPSWPGGLACRAPVAKLTLTWCWNSHHLGRAAQTISETQPRRHKPGD